MGYKKVQSLDADTTISLGGKNRKTGKANPQEVEGYYLGSRKVEDSKKKSGYSYIHIFQTQNGNLGVWGKTDLDRKLLTVTPGTMTLAAFEKMVPTPNGEMYRYEVSVDADNTIEVAAVSSADASSDYVENSESEEYVDAGADDEDEAQTAALAAAERKAKVDALLRGATKGKTKN